MIERGTEEQEQRRCASNVGKKGTMREGVVSRMLRGLVHGRLTTHHHKEDLPGERVDLPLALPESLGGWISNSGSLDGPRQGGRVLLSGTNGTALLQVEEGVEEEQTYLLLWMKTPIAIWAPLRISLPTRKMDTASNAKEVGRQRRQDNAMKAMPPCCECELTGSASLVVANIDMKMPEGAKFCNFARHRMVDS